MDRTNPNPANVTDIGEELFRRGIPFALDVMSDLIWRISITPNCPASEERLREWKRSVDELRQWIDYGATMGDGRRGPKVIRATEAGLWAWSEGA